MKTFDELYMQVQKAYNEKNWRLAKEYLLKMPMQISIPQDRRGMYYFALAQCYFLLREEREAVAYAHKAFQHPLPLESAISLYTEYLFSMHYVSGISDEEIRDAHFAYNKFFSHIAPFQHRKKRKKKLRIGYLTSNLYEHIVVNFAVQLFAGHDQSRYETVLYGINMKHDEVTDWLQSMANGWRDLADMQPQEAAKRIYDDEIDILFDLSGHTDGGKTLRIAAYKPAPVQLSGIGYFDTTGLAAMDYYLSDIYCDPPENDALFRETLLRLPHSHLCYTPPERMLQRLRDYQMHEHIVYGSFNKFSKITDEMLSVWHRIISRVPGSKLLLKNPWRNHRQEKLMRKRARDIGFRPEQLEIRSATFLYLDEYMDMDIALDTYPYPGGGTTCEALYCGVPVITLYGRRHGSRFGYSLLMNAGLGELTASNEDDYVEKAVALANDRSLLQALHDQVNPMLQASPVMDSKGYVREIEKAYERIWQNWQDS